MLVWNYYLNTWRTCSTTIAEVAADWHELITHQRITRPCITGDSEHWTRSAARRHTTFAISHTRPSPVARKLLLISRPAKGRRLSWRLAEGCLQMARVSVEPQPESYESDALLLNHNTYWTVYRQTISTFMRDLFLSFVSTVKINNMPTCSPPAFGPCSCCIKIQAIIQLRASAGHSDWVKPQ